MDDERRTNTAGPAMAKAYAPQEVEQRVYRWWEEQGYFTPTIEPARRPFVIIMPPPNVTGELHLGHALTTAIEDILTRWHRMLGEPTLWLPGSDHAGIATQNVVEQELAREGKSRHDVGREQFVARVWAWRERYGRRITQQLRRLGASCDWSRERFTMDPGPALAVRTTFANLYRKGLIYRGERIINWCPRCATALSDLEVEHEEVASHLYFVRYPLEGGALGGGPGHVTVATTRPETMLGDTAVAVNPADERYIGLEGRRAILPALGRAIPIVPDAAVDPAFGTGAVKVTPAHDPLDFEIGQRHSLPSINVLNLDGTMNGEAGPYAGLDRLACRRQLLADLERAGLLEKVEPHTHAVGHCQRCRTVVEPLVSKQWFVRIKPLAEPAVEAVTSGRIRIIPERFSRVYLNWMDNIRDWCISRQLWWGHRIPVWYCQACEETIASVEEPHSCPRCRSDRLVQDLDVLDTWFSSALWPHSTLGWPEQTADLSYFYPSSVMETGYDILFFWVARMIMLGLENVGDVPFRTVYLHGLVRDEKGEKMSKSKRNVVDPLEVMDRYGTDALRFALATGSTPGNDMRLSPTRLEAGRNFANKLWNAARFVLAQVPARRSAAEFALDRTALNLQDRWILSRLNRLLASVDALLQDLQLGEAGRQIHDFLWGEFCDWYIEMAKIRLREAGERPGPLPVLLHVLDAGLRLLHPFMPFVTEEIWRNVLRTAERPTIMLAAYPQAEPALLDEEAERKLDLIMELVRAIRNARAEFDVEAARWIEATVVGGELAALVREQAAAIAALARVRPLQVVAHLVEKPAQAVALIVGPLEAYLPLAGMVDLAAERERIAREHGEVAGEIARLEAKLANAAFVAKAPAAVVGREREKLADYRDRLAKLAERGDRLQQE